MKLVLFLLDAFRSDYIESGNTPFLSKKSHEGRYIKNIKPSAGFCERTEIFTGLKPNESGYFTAIGFDPDSSPYKDNKVLKFFGYTERILSGLIDAIVSSNKLRLKWIARKVLIKAYKMFGGNIDKLKFYSIPLSFLPYLCLTEDESEIEEKSFPGRKTIFELITEEGKDYFLGSFTSLGKPSNGNDNDRLEKAIKAFEQNDYTLLPIYISMADAYGHRFGPSSAKMKLVSEEIDELLDETVSRFLEADEDTVFMFLGDHGMSEVTSQVDVEKRLIALANTSGLKPGRDYLYFLDSTMFRIWFLNEQAKKVLEPLLKEDNELLKHGEFISEEMIERYSLPDNDRRYGDMIWWANTGTLVFPDFFHRKNIYKGMHGYQPVDSSTFGTCIVWGKGVETNQVAEKDLSQVYDEIKKVIFT